MAAVVAMPATTAVVAQPGKAAHPTRPGSLDGDGEVRWDSTARAVGASSDVLIGVWSSRSGMTTGWFEVHFDPFLMVVGAKLQ
jgi:hypothetical protein